MTKEAQRLGDYLAHIIEAIERIREYTEGLDAVGFKRDRKGQDAVIRNIEIIGEASNNIVRDYPVFAKAHPELPLLLAYDMRNALAQGYFKVDLDIVWNCVVDDLPELYRLVRMAQADVNSD